MASTPPEEAAISSKDLPTRTQSDSDVLTHEPLLNQDRRPTVPRVTSFTFGSSKKLFGGRNTRKQWMFAAKKTKSLTDPWADLGIDSLPEELVMRHMYNAHTKKWKHDKVIVKIQTEPFAHGAMRECFRMKKLSKFSQNPDWKNASNYVAKRYIKEATRETYFEDIKLQMDSKLWGEKYNRMGAVPKKVDFFQTYIIEFQSREGSPLYCVEHFIEGGYVKYNSNSGFVSDLNRLTPQTFSHFTFEKSNHQLIIVDIQGVGDLYTDPQMHTVDQKDYGEANLGVRGMALFFSSHVCSPLCEALGLTQFDLSEQELDTLRSKRWNFSTPTTKISSKDSSSEQEDKKKDALAAKETVEQAFHRLSVSINAEALKNFKPSVSLMADIPESPLPPDTPLESPFVADVIPQVVIEESHPLTQSSDAQENKGDEISIRVHRSDSQCSNESAEEQYMDSCPVDNEGLETCPIDPVLDQEDFGERVDEQMAEGEGHSSSVEKEITRLREDGATGSSETDDLKILGLLHFDLAKLHESGRFATDESPINEEVIKFHLDKAASCGSTLALYTLAHIYLQQPHQDFEGISVEACPENEALGMEYLEGAAENGVTAAMFEVAKALDTGLGARAKNWSKAVEWYHKALQTDSESTDIPADSTAAVDADYLIMARLAELYREGGNGLAKDSQKSGDFYTEAAEAAMASMKGKLSNKYYMLAEEAWGEVED